MSKPSWRDWADPFGVLPDEAGRLIEDAARAPLVATQRAFQRTVSSVAEALVGRTLKTEAMGGAEATVVSVTEILPALAIPGLAAGPVPIWQRLSLDLCDLQWRGRNFGEATVVTRGVSVIPADTDHVHVGRVTIELRSPIDAVEHLLAEVAQPRHARIRGRKLEVRPRRFSRFVAFDVDPVVHQGRAYLAVRDARIFGFSSRLLARMPMALTVDVDLAPPAVSINGFVVDDNDVLSVMSATDITLPLDLQSMFSGVGGDAARFYATLFGSFVDGQDDGGH